MHTKIDEIAPDVFRLSTLVADVAPGGFTFNQFVVRLHVLHHAELGDVHGSSMAEELARHGYRISAGALLG